MVYFYTLNVPVCTKHNLHQLILNQLLLGISKGLKINIAIPETSISKILFNILYIFTFFDLNFYLFQYD